MLDINSSPSTCPSLKHHLPWTRSHHEMFLSHSLHLLYSNWKVRLPQTFAPWNVWDKLVTLDVSQFETPSPVNEVASRNVSLKLVTLAIPIGKSVARKWGCTVECVSSLLPSTNSSLKHRLPWTRSHHEMFGINSPHWRVPLWNIFVESTH